MLMIKSRTVEQRFVFFVPGELTRGIRMTIFFQRIHYAWANFNRIKYTQQRRDGAVEYWPEIVI